MAPERLLPFIPLVPLGSAALLGIWALAAARRGKTGTGAAGWIATAAATTAFVLALLVVSGLRAAPDGRVVADLGTWFAAGNLRVGATLAVDALGATLLLVVSGVGSLIHCYSIGYMAKDPHRARYFCYLNLFLGAMLLLVTAGDLVVLFAGWEGVGLCSYLLIGFWHREAVNTRAGMKAFLVNRVGDAGFILGLCLLAWALVDANGQATLDIAAVHTRAPALNPGLATAAALLLLLGVAGKSAQLPLSVWLPDAMAGPTPVSALIHAATMVTAGVYLLARLDFLYAASPVASAIALGLGATTALVAGVAALGQTDLKRVLAYSTVSQLGFMVAAAGAGAPAAAMFHVVTHAFFKASLFLGAGAVIHALDGEQDLARIAGRARPLRGIAIGMGIGCAALAGLPPLAGFVSKEAVLSAVWEARVPAPLALGAVAALVVAAVATAAYSARLWVLCFVPAAGAHAAPGADAHAHALHHPGWLMTGPVLVLAALAVVGGALAAPIAVPGLGEGWLFAKLGAAAPHAHGAGAWIVLGLSLAALVAGAGFGFATARRPASAILGFTGVDRAATAVARGVADLARGVLVPAIENGILAAAVGTLAVLASALSAIGRLWQAGRVRAYAMAMAAAAAALLWLAVR